MGGPSKPCPECGSSQRFLDEASGCTVCERCGRVFEENRIVAEAQFTETSGGGKQALGQTVGMHFQVRGLNGRVCQSSSEKTYQNIRGLCSGIGAAFRLPDNIIEFAIRSYKLCLLQGYTRGRRSRELAAAALYAGCRREKTHHMLLDFAEYLRMSVHALGKTYVGMIRALNLHREIPLVDPSLMISRFASEMDLGDKASEVATDAMRIVRRLHKDWIAAGRRPAGICGVSLLLAARMHNFKKSVYEMVYIIKMSMAVFHNRMSEFMETPAAQNTVENFRKCNSERMAGDDRAFDPPSFRRARKQEEGLKIEASGQSENTPGTDELTIRTGSEAKGEDSISGVNDDLMVDIDPEDGDEKDEELMVTLENDDDTHASAEPVVELNEGPGDVDEEEEEPLLELEGAEEDNALAERLMWGTDNSLLTAEETQAYGEDGEKLAQELKDMLSHQTIRSAIDGFQNIQLGNRISPSLQLREVASDRQSLGDVNSGDEEIPSDDEDIANAILEPEEVKQRADIWHELHRKFLVEQYEKAVERGESGSVAKTLARRKRTTVSDLPKARNHDEAIDIYISRRVGKKVDLEAIKDLFREKTSHRAFSETPEPGAKFDDYIEARLRGRNITPHMSVEPGCSPRSPSLLRRMVNGRHQEFANGSPSPSKSSREPSQGQGFPASGIASLAHLTPEQLKQKRRRAEWRAFEADRKIRGSRIARLRHGARQLRTGETPSPKLPRSALAAAVLSGRSVTPSSSQGSVTPPPSCRGRSAGSVNRDGSVLPQNVARLAMLREFQREEQRIRAASVPAAPTFAPYYHYYRDAPHLPNPWASLPDIKKTSLGQMEEARRRGEQCPKVLYPGNLGNLAKLMTSKGPVERYYELQSRARQAARLAAANSSGGGSDGDQDGDDVGFDGGRGYKRETSPSVSIGGSSLIEAYIADERGMSLNPADDDDDDVEEQEFELELALDDEEEAE